MKHIVLFFFTTLRLWAYEYHLKPIQVSQDVYCFFGKTENISKENGGNMVNTCFVKTKEGFVVIDSGPTFSYASQAYAQMQKISKLPVKIVINTHDHDDHWLGNSFYKSKDSLLIGPLTYEQNVVPGMHTRMERVLGNKIFEGTKIVKLDKVVEKTYNFTLGDKEFEVKKLVDKAHTKGDLIIVLPKEKIVFAGDLVFNDRLTSIRDGSIIGSLKALKLIDEMNATVVVGGHGYKTDRNATKHLEAYLEEMKREVLSAIEDDVSISDINKRVLMPKYKTMKLYDALQKRNVFEAYRELEFYTDEEEE